MSDLFKLWLRGCELNHTQIYLLEGEGETALYKCWKTYIGEDYHEYNETPVFSVWEGNSDSRASRQWA